MGSRDTYEVWEDKWRVGTYTKSRNIRREWEYTKEVGIYGELRYKRGIRIYIKGGNIQRPEI